MSEENNGFLEMMGRLLKSGAIDQASYDRLMERLTKAQAKAELWEQKKAQQEEQLQALRSLQAMTVVVSISSAIPWASFPITLALAGAIITTSAFFAMETCST